MAPAPKPTSSAMWCTSRASPLSIMRPTLVLCLVRMRWWCTALVVRSDGIGANTSSLFRSESTTIRTPSSMAVLISAQICASAERSPDSPSETRYRPLTTMLRKCEYSPSSLMWMILAKWSLLITGNGKTNCRQCSAFASSRLPSGPTAVPIDVTTSSRIASNGGFVTCANNCWK